LTVGNDRLAVVTGGCGFIGSHLVHRLVAEGRAVRVLDDLSTGDLSRLPAGVEFCRGDVADPAFVRPAVAGAAVVFHLAAVASVQRSNESWLASHLTNGAGSVSVMEAIRDCSPHVAFVYASSAAVYGDVPLAAGERIAERTPPRPLAPYGIDKWTTELHAGVAGTLYRLRSFGLRLFNVYGPGPDPDSPYSGVITRFLAQARAGGPVTVFGDGLQTRDFVHVSDVVRAILLAEAQATPDAPVVNVCTGIPTTVCQLAQAIAASNVDIVHLPTRTWDIRRSLGDPTLAAETLCWHAQVGLEEGLVELAEERGIQGKQPT
jgi:UDP-glucose 4-epimerase